MQGMMCRQEKTKGLGELLGTEGLEAETTDLRV